MLLARPSSQCRLVPKTLFFPSWDGVSSRISAAVSCHVFTSWETAQREAGWGALSGNGTGRRCWYRGIRGWCVCSGAGLFVNWSQMSWGNGKWWCLFCHCVFAVLFFPLVFFSWLKRMRVTLGKEFRSELGCMRISWKYIGKDFECMRMSVQWMLLFFFVFCFLLEGKLVISESAGKNCAVGLSYGTCLCSKEKALLSSVLG